MKEGIVEVLETFVESKLKNVHTCLPGEIRSYNEARREATVKPLVKIRTNKGTRLSIPPISGVPVHFPSSKKFKFIYPLEKKDQGLIVFSEEGIGAFLKGRTEVDADSLAKFNLTDAIFIPGVWSFANIPSGEQSTIEIDSDGNIKLNGESKRFVTYTELDTALQGLISYINGHLHTGVTTGAGVSGVPSVPASLDISAAETQTIRTGG